jgi:Flp pilus assembly secretin CpaC
VRRIVRFLAVSALFPAAAAAQERSLEPAVTRIDLPIGRSYPIETTVPITQVSVANPEVADVVVIDARSVVVNARASGETDVILWGTGVPRRHFRILVHSPSDRMQIALGIKLAEARRPAGDRRLAPLPRRRDPHRDGAVPQRQPVRPRDG